MKKYLVLLLVFALCMGTYAVPALAEEAAYDIKVQAEHYDVYNWLYDISADGVIQAYTGNSGEYILEFAETGVYEVAINAAIQQKMTHSMQLYVDGVSQGSVTFATDEVAAAGSTYNNYAVGKINVQTPGRHTIKLLMNSGNVKIDYFTFTRTSDIQITKAASAYDTIETSYQSGTTFYHFNYTNRDYGEYTVEFPTAGIYDLSINYGSYNNTQLKISFDDVVVKNSVTITPSAAGVSNAVYLTSYFTDASLCTLTVPKAGKYKFRIDSAWSAIAIRRFTFTRTGSFAVTKAGKEYDTETSKIGDDVATHVELYSPENYATYNMDIPAPGVYGLTGELSGYYGSSYVKTVFDGNVIKESTSAANSGGLGSMHNANLGYVYVDEAGTYSLKILPTSSSQVRIYSLTATHLSDKPGVYMTTSWDAENKKVNYVVNNYTGSDITDAVLFSAVYSQDGTTLKDVDRVETTLKVGANSVSTETLNYASRNKVKAFIWDSVDDIKPIVKEQYVNPCN